MAVFLFFVVNWADRDVQPHIKLTELKLHEAMFFCSFEHIESQLSQSLNKMWFEERTVTTQT